MRLLEEKELNCQLGRKENCPGDGHLGVYGTDPRMPVPTQRPAAGDVTRPGHQRPAGDDAHSAQNDGESPADDCGYKVPLCPVEQLCDRATGLALSVICAPEIISALNRRLREGSLSHNQYRQAKLRLSAEVADATIVNVVPAVVADAIKILETNAVRAMDALHVASALQWNAELFVSSDDRQVRAATRRW